MLDESQLKSCNFIASWPYHCDSFTWCVQKAQKIPVWKNLFYMCNDSMPWAIFTAMALCAIFFAYFVQQFEDQKWTWFKITITSICLVCNYPTEYRPKTISNRIFFICCLFGTMVYSNHIYSNHDKVSGQSSSP